MTAARRALVLAGGAFAASAWEIGLVSGMAAAGVDLRDSDLFIGTSAGARVGLYLAYGVDLEELFEQQFAPLPERLIGVPAAIDWKMVGAEWARAKTSGGTSTAILRRVGALALAVTGGDAGERRRTVSAQLPGQHWPAKKLLIVTVNAETGERRAFDGTSGVELVDAMVATTAFFGWPPATIEGQRYIDGGFYSSDNSDLAAGIQHVTVLALHPPPGGTRALVSLDQGVASLRAAGSTVEVIQPDDECVAAFASVGSVMNPAVRAPAAKAGRAQGERLVKSSGFGFA